MISVYAQIIPNTAATNLKRGEMLVETAVDGRINVGFTDKGLETSGSRAVTLYRVTRAWGAKLYR